MFNTPTWIAIALLAFLGGAFSGWEHEHGKYLAYRASVLAAGEAQERQTAQTIQKHKQIAQDVKNDYETRIAAIRAAYRVRPSGSGLVPSATPAASRFDGTAAYDILAEQCTETTQQLVSLQDFIKETQ